MIKRSGAGWAVDIYLDGRVGRRVRKQGFRTRVEAVNYLRGLRGGVVSGRRLSSLVKVWFDLHGQSLKDSKYRLSRTLAVCRRLGDPMVDDFTALDWAEYRSARRLTVSASTVNHEQRYLSAVLAELVRMGHISANPLALVRQIKIRAPEMAFLTLDQCETLLSECLASSNPHCYPVTVLCLATGARWSEAEGLRHEFVLPGKVLFDDTKNGKSRAVPVDPAVMSDVLGRALPGPGRLFGSCRDAFRAAYRRAGFRTPQQLTHILRHTFASHYMMGGGDILALQRILGHGSVNVTMRYAHLAPEYLESAVSLNPMARLGVSRPACRQDVGKM